MIFSMSYLARYAVTPNNLIGQTPLFRATCLDQAIYLVFLMNDRKREAVSKHANIIVHTVFPARPPRQAASHACGFARTRTHIHTRSHTGMRHPSHFAQAYDFIEMTLINQPWPAKACHASALGSRDQAKACENGPAILCAARSLRCCSTQRTQRFTSMARGRDAL